MTLNNQFQKSLDFIVHGGKQLSGNINTNCSKNGAMGLLCSVLLNSNTTILHGIPRIEEVHRIIEVLQSIGTQIDWINENSLKITSPSNFELERINKEAANRTRTILMFLGPLIHRFEKFSLPHSQGCNLGKRTINPHLYGLQKLGVDIHVTDDKYEVSVTKSVLYQQEDIEIVMYEASDTGAELLLMAAAGRPCKTIIKFAPSNYMVQEVCFFLQKLGVKIDGVGTHILTVQGRKEFARGIEYHNSEDPIESMMFISAAIVTKSTLTINRCPIDFLELELLKLSKMGLQYEQTQKYKSNNQQTNLVDLTIFPSNLVALSDKITCGAYPDINMDNLPFFVPIACKAEGQTLIHDWVYENRAIYFTELNRLNASITLLDPHRLYVNGKVEFKPAQVVCPPALRPAMIILIAMLAAPGTSILRNVYSIKRGYEEIAERLNSIGAEIEVL